MNACIPAWSKWQPLGFTRLITWLIWTRSNIFVGPFAGYYNYPYHTGANNTYIGNAAGLNAEGSANTFVGFSAGWTGTAAQTTGSHNTFVGEYAGASTGSGKESSPFGYLAGIFNTGDFNLYLANPGVASESNTIRIGNQGPQQHTYIAGIFNENVDIDSAQYVLADKNGKIGTIPHPLSLKEMENLRMAVAAQQDVIKTQQQQIQAQTEQIETLAQRLARLESLIANK